MKVTDDFINNILKEMGVNPNEPPRWKQHYHEFIDLSTGNVFDRMKDGYFCSYCGKYSYYQAGKCDGCNSIMQKRSNNNE